MSKDKKILLGVTGSIAVYKSADLIRRFKKDGYRVSVVMTREAEKFITPLTLGSLCGQKVFQDMFDDDSWRMNHIVLAKEIDLFLIAPATANVVGKIACGLADDLLTTIVLATKAKIIIAPAMNDEMFKNKIVQENIKKLKSLGMLFVPPVKGNLACGTYGDGHLAEIEDIVKTVKSIV